MSSAVDSPSPSPALRAAADALIAAPTSFEAHFYLSRALIEARRAAEAIVVLESAARLAPDRPEPATGIGLAYVQLRQPDAARQAFARALELSPAYESALLNYAQLETDSGRCDQALVLLERALRERPTDPTLHYHVARTLARDGRSTDALVRAQWLTTHYPDFALGHSIFGHALTLVGDANAAERAMRRAIALDPTLWIAHYALGELCLARGDYANGWAEMEWRLAAPEFTPVAHYRAARWQGEPLTGKTIIVFAEQGIGDTLQAARYVPHLAALGANVVMEVQPAIKSLLARLPGSRLVIAQGEPIPPADYAVPFFSLPMHFGTTPESIPSAAGYLSAEPTRAEHWKQALPRAAKRIGLVWSGNPIQLLDRYRSIGLAPLEPLFEREDIHWIALKPELDLEEQGLLARHANVSHIPAGLDDVAAMLVNCDALVTTCTSFAHLAGALGVPTILMLAAAADWRWLRDRDDSPWYRSIRLVRQPTLGDWPSVVARVGTLV